MFWLQYLWIVTYRALLPLLGAWILANMNPQINLWFTAWILTFLNLCAVLLIQQFALKKQCQNAGTLVEVDE